MSIEKLFPSGAWLIEDIINGVYCKKVYYFYTKREAIADFKKEFKCTSTKRKRNW